MTRLCDEVKITEIIWDEKWGEPDWPPMMADSEK